MPVYFSLLYTFGKMFFLFVFVPSVIYQSKPICAMAVLNAVTHLEFMYSLGLGLFSRGEFVCLVFVVRVCVIFIGCVYRVTKFCLVVFQYF